MRDGSSHNAQKMLAETRRLKQQCEQVMQRADAETKEKEKNTVSERGNQESHKLNTRNLRGESRSWNTQRIQVRLTTQNCLPR